MLQFSIQKKINLIIFLVALQFSIFGQKQPYSDKSTGIANIAISKEEAREYINTFKGLFKQTEGDIKTLEDSFYIDFPFIEKFTLMLEKKLNDYNGFRFVLTTDVSSNKQKVFLVPTRKITSSTENRNIWVKLPNTTGCEFRNFNVLGIPRAHDMEAKFRTYHRMEETANKRDSLSKSIWMSKEIMQFIRDTIKNHPETGLNKLVGVRVFNACYPKKMGTIPGVNHIKQSTVVIVFMKKDVNGNLYEYWDFNDRFREQIISGNNKRFGKDVLNHGELCPSRCGEE